MVGWPKQTYVCTRSNLSCSHVREPVNFSLLGDGSVSWCCSSLRCRRQATIDLLLELPGDRQDQQISPNMQWWVVKPSPFGCGRRRGEVPYEPHQEAMVWTPAAALGHGGPQSPLGGVAATWAPQRRRGYPGAPRGPRRRGRRKGGVRDRPTGLQRFGATGRCADPAWAMVPRAATTRTWQTGGQLPLGD